MALSEARRQTIRRQYRTWRAALDLTQVDVEDRAREIYPEFPIGTYWKIENGLEFPSPTARKALAQVLNVKERALPSPEAMQERAS